MKGVCSTLFLTYCVGLIIQGRCSATRLKSESTYPTQFFNKTETSTTSFYIRRLLPGWFIALIPGFIPHLNQGLIMQKLINSVQNYASGK